jgi:anhydro-N-acetylmuramic acid kinase
LAYVYLNENEGKWHFEIKAAACLPYNNIWKKNLINSTHLPALDFMLLHTEYGALLGKEVRRFIRSNDLNGKVDLIVSHGHTVFHISGKNTSVQLGHGAAIAAKVQLPVISDLRAMDMAYHGQGAPIVPVGEKLLFSDYSCFLNIGGIANISFIAGDKRIAFDVCPANRVLNLLTNETGKNFDEDGLIASTGNINEPLLNRLNTLDYYKQPYPKSLDNGFGVEVIYPLIKESSISIPDALATYSEHIALQIANTLKNNMGKMLVTGGGAFNKFLIGRMKAHLKSIEVIIPDEKIICYKEALIMALLGVLRWRNEANVLSSVTGASKDSIGGALWMAGE